jgi:putative membrane protein
MKALSVFFKDTKAIAAKPLLLISFIAVAFIPILYSGILLSASWDPYGHLDKLPVAVVNLDQGAQYEGKALKVGSDFVGELKKNDDFDWHFVDKDEAESGMQHKKYYMTLTIPADFSDKATTLMNKNPQPAQLIFEPNGDYNYIGGQIGNSAIKDIKAQLSAKVTEAYTKSMFDQLSDISKGFNDAGNGAGEITKGAGKLVSGTVLLKQNLDKLVSGAGQVQSGTKPLLAGADKLVQGLSRLGSGSADLAAGLQQLTAAERKLQDGASRSGQGIGTLEAGLQSSSTGADNLTAGLRSSLDGSAKLESGLASAASGSADVAGGAQSVAAGLEQLAASNPQLAQSPDFQKLLKASQDVAKGSEQLHQSQQQLAAGSMSLRQGQEQLLSGSEKLSGAQDQLLQGAKQLHQGQTQLADGLTQFGAKLNEASQGGGKLAAGAKQLDDGAQQLENGLRLLSGGVSTLTSGSEQLSTGAGKLAGGVTELAGGSQQLADELNKAADKTADVKATDETVSMFAEPVQIVENTGHKVNNYGAGIAPYFISLGLFVGALIFTTIFSARETTVPNASRAGRFLSRTLTFTGMSIVQSCIAVLILLYGVGLNVQSVPVFFLFSLITSLTFTLIIQTLVTWLDQPGRFLAVLIMILQLTASAGTFPLELLPGWLKGVHPWLPMTHSIDGFRAVISSGDFGEVWGQAGRLAIYAVIALALTAIYFLRRGRGEQLASGSVSSAL